MISRRLLRIKVIKALYSHLSTGGDSLIASQKTLMHSVAKSYDLYHLLLRLIVDVADHAEGVIEQRRKKKLPTQEDLNPNTKFVDNRVVALIRNSESLNGYLESKGLSWAHRGELVRKLYQNLIAKPYYKDYMAEPKRSFPEDVRLVTDFFSNELEDFGYFYEVLEEDSIYWMDEMEFELSQAIKTLKALGREDADLKLQPLYKDPEDQQYVKDLFTTAVVKHGESLAYIEKFISNWDLERVAFMDKIIMLAALTELTGFATIPVKVTLDEYIEISKYYSTPNSGFFINGVMDRIVDDLRKNGRLNKLGRGLVEK